MDLNTKLQVIRTEIDFNIKFFTAKHHWTKRRATILRITSVSFSASITVLLGLNIAGLIDLFKNTAIVMGAIVTIISAVDAFYNYSSLWVKNAVTLSRLRELKREVDYYASGCEEQDLSENKLNKFMNDLQKILKEDMKQWLRVREKANSMEQEKDNASLNDIKLRTQREEETDRFRSSNPAKEKEKTKE